MTEPAFTGLPRLAGQALWRGAGGRTICAGLMDTARLNRIRFRAWRRGFREADLILGPFADRYVGAMSARELDRFECLLEQPDHDIYGWIMGSLPIPAPFDDDLMVRLRAFRPPLTSGRGG